MEGESCIAVVVLRVRLRWDKVHACRNAVICHWVLESCSKEIVFMIMVTLYSFG